MWKNENGITGRPYTLHGEKGYYVTHRNPSNGYLWVENPTDPLFLGFWFKSENVKFI